MATAIAIAAICPCTLSLTGCGGAEEALRVTVSVPPQVWLVKKIAPAGVEVEALVGPGDDPHSFTPSDRQITRAMRSAFFVRIGAPFEQGPWFQSLSESGKVKMIDGLDKMQLRNAEPHAHDEPGHEPGEHHDHHEHAGHDPSAHAHGGHAHEHEHEELDTHVWLSPRLLKIQARTIADALGDKLPERKDEIEKHFDAFVGEMNALDAEVRATLDPLTDRAFYVYHPAWGYFADEYDLTQIAIEREGKAPTEQQLTAFQDEAKQAGAKVIFIQPQRNDAAAKSIAKAIGGRVEMLDPLKENVAENLRAAAKALAALENSKH